jgi:hypothetical protein
MRRPSGEKLGEVSIPGACVSRCGVPVPSALAIQMSVFPFADSA